MFNAYQNKSEKAILSPEDAAKKHAALLTDIAFLEGKIEEYKLVEIDLISLTEKKVSCALDIESLKTEISKLNEKRTELIRQNSIIPEGVKIEIESQNKELARLKIELSNINAVIEEKNAIKSSIERVLPVMQQEFDLLKEKLDGIKTEKNLVIADLDAKITIKAKELKDIEISLDGSSSKHARILSAIDDMKKEIASVGKEKKNLYTELGTISARHNELSKTIQQREEDHIAKCKERESILDSRETDLNTREGNLSDNEAMYEKKKKALIETKAGLEEFHGKKIPINI